MLKLNSKIIFLTFNISIIIFSILLYSVFSSNLFILTVSSLAFLENLAYFTLILIIFGLSGILSLFWKKTNKKPDLINIKNKNLLNFIYDCLGYKYDKIPFLTTIIYSFIFAFISGIIIFNPFSNINSIFYPSFSLHVTVCCGFITQMPTITAFLTDYLIISLSPFKVIMLVIFSILSSINFTLIYSSYKFQLISSHNQIFGGISTLFGLFTSCPSCGGLFLLGLTGSLGFFTIMTLLIKFYPYLMIGGAIGFMISIILLSKNLLKKLNNACKIS